MKLNHEKLLQEFGADFETPADAVNYIKRLLEYFQFHNKNLTKEQERKIGLLSVIVNCFQNDEEVL